MRLKEAVIFDVSEIGEISDHAQKSLIFDMSEIGEISEHVKNHHKKRCF